MHSWSSRSFSQLATVLLLLAPRFALGGTVSKNGTICTIQPSLNGTDDTPAILYAFEQCGKDGSVVFQNATYNIEQVMTTTGLENVVVDLSGTLLWGTNTSYWQNNSLPLGYQNQSTAWIFGGTNVSFVGHGYGTFDGNGQIWYDLANGTDNLPGRPISLTIANTTNATFSGLRFVQSQFWTTAITHSENILLEDFYVNSTSSTGTSTLNTDGSDTFYSNNITFRNWTVVNGDDAIAPKANSSNILIQDSVFWNGNGVAIGSIGQYLDAYEFIENVTAENIVCNGCLYIGYVKTWPGVQQGFPPNGGGGGLGYAKNIVFRNFIANNVTSSIAEITQCTTYNGATGECDTSKFQISNVTWGPGEGTVFGDTLAAFQCSGAVPCPGIELVGGLSGVKTNGTVRSIDCSNIEDPIGFNCTEGS
ncbi:glycoside hydrolase family 28 protein [Jaapia argillacea MUCL 33604]|uniref:Glycoside hydrolase family 28 protein n=1 Tax=Jaapia argillacea MUCL 33604 TaxID=933084 RepID=A0A067PQH9_9AGAM|nr:glycoside hydrolase family 28 protein [Jaapia argillacea MUCL 33604]